MKEIKLKEIKPGMVMHCETMEEMKELLVHIDSEKDAENLWKMADSYGKVDCVRMGAIYGDCACGSIGFYKNNGYEIIEFSDLILPETMTEEEAYKKGREDAFEEVKNCEAYGYDCGLKDAWELARKLAKCSPKELDEMYFSGLTHAVVEHTYHEALAKVEAYEKEKEIKVGDAVYNTNNYQNAMVLWVGKDTATVIELFGEQLRIHTPPIGALKKTDKHFDITAFLAEIGKE